MSRTRTLFLCLGLVTACGPGIPEGPATVPRWMPDYALLIDPERLADGVESTWQFELLEVVEGQVAWRREEFCGLPKNSYSMKLELLESDSEEVLALQPAPSADAPWYPYHSMSVQKADCHELLVSVQRKTGTAGDFFARETYAPCFGGPDGCYVSDCENDTEPSEPVPEQCEE